MKTLKLFVMLAISAVMLCVATSCGSSEGTEDNNEEQEHVGVYVINGHRFVDLGLPSGLLWAETNVGAKTAADDGCYFAWGETDMTTKTSYDWKTYSYGSSPDNLTSYNTVDGKNTLAKSNDAAYVNWGESCRMPTKEEFDELLNTSYCTWTWTDTTTSDGSSVAGYKVTSTKNGNSIFLPASGYRYEKDLLKRSSYGRYWSSSLNTGESGYAYALRFLDDQYYLGYRYRFYGHTVRPVAEH